MSRSRERYLSLEGAAVRDHWLPMEILARLMTGWGRAFSAALPDMIIHLGMVDEELDRSLPRIRPVTGPSLPGSLRAPYGLQVQRDPDQSELFEVSAAVLDDLVGGFEAGVAELQHGRVIGWMTSGVARSLLDGVSCLLAGEVTLRLEESGITLAAEAESTLREFIRREDEARKAEVQVLGVISSVNMKSSYLYVDSTRSGSLKSTFADAFGRDLCEAMANRERVELTVSASVASDGTLRNANLRSLKRLGPRPSYVDVFRSLWGSQREMYEGVPHDERGVPDPDPEPQQ